MFKQKLSNEMLTCGTSRMVRSCLAKSRDIAHNSICCIELGNIPDVGIKKTLVRPG